MKSNIWGTTGRKEADNWGEDPLPPGTPPTVLVPVLLHLWGSSRECQALRKTNKAVAGRTTKSESIVWREELTERMTRMKAVQ